MKKIIFGLLLLGSCIAKAQKISPKDPVYKENLDTLIKYMTALDEKLITQRNIDCTAVISPLVFNKFVENKFTYLSFERSELPTTNSASLDISDNATKLKLAFAKKFSDNNEKIKAIVSAGVQAKLGEGVSEIFKGNVPSSGTSIFLNGAFLHKLKTNTVIASGSGGTLSPPKSLLGLRKRLTDYYNANFADKYNPVFLDKKYRTLIEALKNIEQEIENGSATMPCCNLLFEEKKRLEQRKWELERDQKTGNNELIELIVIRIKQLETEICNCTNENHAAAKTKFYKEKEEIEKQLLEVGISEGTADDAAKAIWDKYQTGYYDVVTKSPIWEYYKLSWTNFGVTYSRSSYTTYDGTLGLNKRFGSKDFDAIGFKISHSWFRQNIQDKRFVRSRYLGISYEPSLTNNYEDLTPKDIQKNIVLANVPDTNYVNQTAKKARDITGKPYTTSWQHGLSAAYTAMFFKKANLGINLLFQSRFSEISKPVFNSKIGAIVSMANSDYDPEDKKTKAKVNFELFIQFPDMSDVGQSGKSVWQNRVIGISTNIPFNKIFLK